MSTRSRERSFIIRSSLDIQPVLCLRLPDRRTSFSSLESPRKPFYEHRLENAGLPRLRTRCAGKRGACQRHTGCAGHARTAARSARRTASCRQQNTARTVVGEEGYGTGRVRPPGTSRATPRTPGSCGAERPAMSSTTRARQENGNQPSNARAPRWRVGAEARGPRHQTPWVCGVQAGAGS